MVLTDDATGVHGGAHGGVHGGYGPLEVLAPQARRLRPARWLSPQLVIGAVLVLVSVVVGARLLAADHTQAVLVAAHDLAPGQPLTPDLVEERRVDLSESADLYHAGSVGEGYVVVEAVSAGELVARSAVVPAEDVTTGDEALRYVTVSLPAAELPAGLAAGDAVDVWSVPAEGGEGRARILASAVRVVSVAGPGQGTGTLAVEGSRTSVGLSVTGSTLAPKDGAASPLDSLVALLVQAARDARVYLTELPAAGGQG